MTAPSPQPSDANATPTPPVTPIPAAPAPSPGASLTIPVPASRAAWLAVGLAIGLLLAVASPLLAPGGAGPSLAPGRTLAADPAASSAPQRTISVTGTGKVVIAPDVADVRLGVRVTKPTAKDARAAAAEIMTAVIAAIKAAGVADADLKTTTLSLSPVYEYPSGGSPRLTGYQLVNAVVVTVRQLDTVSAVVDGAMAAGANTMDGVTFRVADAAKAEEQARQAAMLQARAKAQTLASTAGSVIDTVASITETSMGTPYPVALNGAGAAAKDASTPIQAGTNEVTVTVSVVFLLR